MTITPENATVLNTTVLSNFAQIDRVELLLNLPRLVTVNEVHEELKRGTETHPYLERALVVLEDEILVVAPSVPAGSSEKKLLETLDPGEAQALAVAETTDGMLLTDDRDARGAARRRDVELTGSIGLLVRFVEDGHISAGTADEYLKQWIDEAGFRSPARNFDRFLEE